MSHATPDRPANPGLTEVPCPVCGADEPKPLFSTKDYVFGCSDDIFGVKRCKVCGCGYVSPRPTRDSMDSFYPQEYYWAWEGGSQALTWDETLQRRGGQIEEKSRWLSDMPPGRLLDVGAQKGEFLWFMKERGWQVEGVDLDNSVPNPANMPIRYGDFLTMEFEENCYDVITFWAVLEHVYDPAVFVRKASRLLRPGGRLIALVTNMNSIQSRYYRSDDYPRHLTIFTKGAIGRLCTDTGLDLGRVHTGQEIFGASLSGGLLFLFKRLFGYAATDAFTEWHQFRDPDLFWTKWRGKPSLAVKMVSRLDRLLTYPVELALDKLGYGQILTFAATKTHE